MAKTKETILIPDSPGVYIAAMHQKHELNSLQAENVLLYTYFLCEVQKDLGII